MPDDKAVKMSEGQLVGEGGNDGPSRIQCAHNGRQEFIIYHPNATDGELIIDYSPELNQPGSTIAENSAASISRIKATPNIEIGPTFQVDLTNEAYGQNFEVTWYRVTNGDYVAGGSIIGNGWTTFNSPWIGEDVVLYLKRSIPICKADFNNDKIVDDLDLDLSVSNFGIDNCMLWPESCDGDIDNDTDIDSYDLSAVITEYGRNDCP
jgi:hypothetical protein